jgi:hypothetical protein
MHFCSAEIQSGTGVPHFHRRSSSYGGQAKDGCAVKCGKETRHFLNLEPLNH